MNEIIDCLKKILVQAEKFGDMLKSVYDPDADGVVNDSDKLEGSTKTQVQDHTPKAHTLASHSTKAHSELTGVGANQHHSEAHTHPDIKKIIMRDEALKVLDIDDQAPGGSGTWTDLDLTADTSATADGVFIRIRAKGHGGLAECDVRKKGATFDMGAISWIQNHWGSNSFYLKTDNAQKIQYRTVTSAGNISVDIHLFGYTQPM